MKKSLTIAAAVLGSLAVAVPTASAAHGQGDLTIGMNGARVVGTQGDPNGSGKIDLSFFDAVDNPTVAFPGEHYICWELTYRNIEDPVAMHIHQVSGAEKNPNKDAGGVVVNLLADTVSEGDATCVAVDETTFDAIRENPRQYYVNVHTPSHPGGAIRGQLHAFS